MNKDQRIFIAGHKGMVGSAILRLLDAEKFSNLITADRSQLDLTSQIQVQDCYAGHQGYAVLSARTPDMADLRIHSQFPLPRCLRRHEFVAHLIPIRSAG